MLRLNKIPNANTLHFIYVNNGNKYKMMALDLDGRTSNNRGFWLDMNVSLCCQMTFTCYMQKAYTQFT